MKMTTTRSVLHTLIVMLHCIYTNAVTDLLTTGASCIVSSLIPGSFSPSYSSSSMEGSCNSILSCRALSGVSLGRCPGTNVCCAYVRTCDQRSSQNHTYFVNPAYPSPYNGTNNCALTIYKAFPYRICQLRLDFLDFDINRPLNGNCETDRFVISGQNTNSVIPAICGRNNGQHMYVDVDNVQGPFTLRVLTSGSGYRRWNIHVSQIECNNPSRAPQNCLQYYLGPRGTISSFNYETTLIQTSTTTVSPTTQFTDASYLNGMDYAICFRKEAGFCSQTYSANTTGPFQIINANADGSEISPTIQANAGVTQCPNDYLLLNGIRFCGSYLNLAGLRGTSRVNAPVTDATRGPFIARFVSDTHTVRRGFQITYQQNLCGVVLPADVIPPTTG